MSTVVTIDSTALELEAGKAYLFADNSGAETLYKYQLASGTTGNITTGVLTALGVAVESLPVIVYQADLLRCLNETISSVDGVTVANDGKSSASVEYVKRSVSNKLDKADFLTKTAVIEKKIADLEEGGGSSTPGTEQPAASGITEIYDTASTTATLNVEDGKCYRFKQPLGRLIVNSIERGTIGSTIMFTCTDAVNVIKATSVVIGGYGYKYNSEPSGGGFDEEFSIELVADSLVTTGINRRYSASFIGKDPGVNPTGARSDSANWTYTCYYSTSANRWEISAQCTYVEQVSNGRLVVGVSNSSATGTVELDAVYDYPLDYTYYTGATVLYRNNTYNLSFVSYRVENTGESGFALITGTATTLYENNGVYTDASGNPVVFHTKIDGTNYGYLALRDFIDGGVVGVSDEPININGVIYDTVTSLASIDATYTSDELFGIFAYGETSVEDISEVEWTIDGGYEFLPSGVCDIDEDNPLGSPYRRNEFVRITDSTTLSDPVVQFPGTIHRPKTAPVQTFVKGSSYVVNFWNNIMTVAELELGSGGEI